MKDVAEFGFKQRPPSVPAAAACQMYALKSAPVCAQAYQQPLGGGLGAAFGAASQAPAPLAGRPKSDAFDPLAPIDVDKLNSAFIHRHQAALLGAHLRA